MELENIKIEGRIGTWYEIDRLEKDGFIYMMFEISKTLWNVSDIRQKK